LRQPSTRRLSATSTSASRIARVWPDTDARGLPFVLDTVTWRANPDWGARLGYSSAELAAANRRAVEFARSIAAHGDRVVVNGVVGPRCDGYVAAERMSADEAAAYHGQQISWLSEAGAERITALTLADPDEATGVVQAAAAEFFMLNCAHPTHIAARPSV
jgi:homocysteine S-methyltransferase